MELGGFLVVDRGGGCGGEVSPTPILIVLQKARATCFFLSTTIKGSVCFVRTGKLYR